MLQTITLRPPIDEPTLKLQRDYAGHVLILRGSLPNAGVAQAPGQDVQRLTLQGHDNGTVEAGKEVRVQQLAPTVPVAAFVGTLPMAIRAEVTPPNNYYGVFLTVPAGFEQGEVRVQWPTRTIPADPPLRLKKADLDIAFDLIHREGEPGAWIRIGPFSSKPVAVEIGDAFATDFSWDEGVLHAVVPEEVERGRVRVVTADGKRYRSRDFFEPIFDVEAFDLVDREGEPGHEIRIGLFHSPPIAVKIGDAPVSRIATIDGALLAEVPEAAERGYVDVLTADGKHHLSKQRFEPTKYKDGET